eukprot:CAMPEP_0118658416 /NCGR_PEP_ID=MMETSP0785-20121206/14556_1 /TAXON_ID=91992 /ORGANISM="Bolidomonas pacifica, Strain CCMP 1866" /LENGTH=270 /DNA_ID=CAMNT_0006551431 /DNA_START=57 /DNA_END=866 /DNA_ORIENTATION=+
MAPPTATYQALLSTFATHPSPPIPTVVRNVPLLYYICHNGHIDLLERLRSLDYLGVNPSDHNHPPHALAGATPLWAALSRGHLDCAKLLLSDDRVTMSQAFSCSNVPNPIIVASQDGHSEALEVMCEFAKSEGGRIDDTMKGGETAVFKAAQNGRIECCRTLIKFGASASKPANSGLAPLAIAASSSREDVVLFLLENGGLDSGGGEAVKLALLHCVRGLKKAVVEKVFDFIGMEKARGIVLDCGPDFFVYLISSSKIGSGDCLETLCWL